MHVGEEQGRQEMFPIDLDKAREHHNERERRYGASKSEGCTYLSLVTSVTSLFLNHIKAIESKPEEPMTEDCLVRGT